ncbi:MAG: MTH1187 family thiamine-binding protein [Solirubrobacterales bacterium]|nr:MTH1187 family thiamine-binding protein [Solirubrobacterales bacterium]MCB0861981.1 MTH1187 family thiamine-binding protein [Solirubrobacterales bacterium]MCB8915331.1 MTH1187 family thiamine-binding protein [Thermoleophilales bacterium]
MATAEITVLPIGREGASVSDLLAVIARHLEGQDKVRFEIHAMGTALEGEPEDIFALAAKIHALPFDSGIPRVYTILKIDQRTDKEQTLESKVRAVTDRL